MLTAFAGGCHAAGLRAAPALPGSASCRARVLRHGKPQHPLSPRRSRILAMAKGTVDPDDTSKQPAPGGPGDESTPPDSSQQHDVPHSNVDWNSEWTRFKDAGMKTEAGKGRQPDSPQVLAAKKAVGTARRSLDSARASVPTRRALFNDWKFWVGIIVALSLFTAAVNSSTQGVGHM